MWRYDTAASKELCNSFSCFIQLRFVTDIETSRTICYASLTAYGEKTSRQEDKIINLRFLSHKIAFLTAMEETDDTHKTKVSDSAYSNSCNSQSQRSSGSSKSRHSTSSGSSGYCGHPSTVGSNNEAFPQPQATKRKDKKKKLIKIIEYTSSNGVSGANASGSSMQGGHSSSGSGGSCSASSGEGSGTSTNGAAPGGIVPTGTLENKSMQMAALSQSLSAKKKLKIKEQPGAIPEEVEVSGASKTVTEHEQEERILHCLQEEQYTQNEGEFCTVVSMHDGVVMYTTASLTEVLGFPKDMWLGRSFIDFVHPKDRISFASHITSGVAAPKVGVKGGATNKNSFFCSLRQYRGLKSNGFGVTEKKVTYRPFRLSMTFKELGADAVGNKDGTGPQGKFLLITAVPVHSVYKSTYIITKWYIMVL
ncbi:hypothetical protein B566_EDAN017420 [Ephemera danica]|nr:hypothetical protein B566_EDAN017420 [Ephemera danica]